MHPSKLPLPRADYKDIDTGRQVIDSLRNLTMSLKSRELRLRRVEPVSSLRADFAAGSNDDSDEMPVESANKHSAKVTKRFSKNSKSDTKTSSFEDRDENEKVDEKAE